MGLNIAVFVPEGIVLSSDSLAILRQEDDGFEAFSKRTFTIYGRYIISFIGCGFINEKPYGYYVQEIESQGMLVKIKTVKDLVHYVAGFFRQFQNEQNEPLTAYVAGSERGESGIQYELYLINQEEITLLNQPNGDREVYNYHVIGHSIWINKIVLPTTFIDDHSDIKESFDAVRIDFSKYSLEDAKKFSEFLIRISAKMDKFVQTRASVNSSITTGILTIQGAEVKQHEFD